MDNQNLLNRAIAAHFRSATEGQPLQPSNASEVRTVDGKHYVVLRNVAGILKVYRVRNDGVLKGLKRWPAELE
ncbi:hypothetical protein ACFIQF_19205 [Comamonas sp. J-3]|uniref:hypothetical protein n=1 Tax=Comamonas trifloxystrobinivorans TaxID=3350256 RepID=UPI00372A02C3